MGKIIDPIHMLLNEACLISNYSYQHKRKGCQQIKGNRFLKGEEGKWVVKSSLGVNSVTFMNSLRNEIKIGLSQ